MRIRLLTCICLLISSFSFANETTNSKVKETTTAEKNALMPIISIDDVTVFENIHTIYIPIYLDAPDSVDTVINVTTVDGTAVSPNDYTALSATVTIPAGQTNVTVSIYIPDDSLAETTEDFSIQGTVTSGNTNNNSVSATITLVDQDDSSFSIGDVTVTEEDGSASVPISIDSPSSTDTIISITTTDNSAIDPNDYTTTTVTATIPAGQLSIYVSIPIADDNVGEPTEDFTINGIVAVGNTINNSDSGTITIIDDDTPAMTISDASVNEDVGNADVVISITNPSAVDTVISISLIEDSATNFDDYVSTVSMVAIPAGQTSISLSIPIVDDLEDEADETFSVYGIIQSGNTSNPDANGIVTIIDNDVCTSDPATDCDGDGVTNGDESNPPNAGTPTNPNDPCDFNMSDITLAQSGDYLTGDCDGDNTLNAVDCDPFNGAITDGYGDACDDGNPATLSDFIDENCNCIGLATNDADGDGISNVQEVMNGTDYNDPCDPEQDVGYTGYDADNSVWQAGNCDNDDINNALEIILGSDPYDTNYNTIQGSVVYDVNGDGCNGTDDIALANVNVAISDGSVITATSIDNAGNYSYSATTGTYYITPNIENFTFFNITPQNASTNFSSTNNSVFNQDFCITNNGVNPDVEVVIAPIAFARPGFDAEYVLTYRNKGNQVTSGSISFMYDDAVLDFVSSTQTTSSQTTGVLNWNYTDLAPFESRSINIILNVNSPAETPSVNNGDELDFSVIINPIAGDILPDDNQFEYEQTVVGSYDPNDITCIEGSVVNPDEIGEYLHYIINFENTGTFFAENIVVEMDIDPAQFDINTLRLLSSSHGINVVVSGNMVRFIFQSIFLPVDGKGNFLLKIKSQSTLVVNDTVSNDARIFFDYNLPIQTNYAETTFAVLSTENFEEDRSITIYPNPTKDNISIIADNSIKSIELYDMQGRVLMQEKYNAKHVNVNIANQASGIYFIKISTEKGVNTEKIIKM